MQRSTFTRRSALALTSATGVSALAGCARGTLTRPAPEDVITLNNDNTTWTPGYNAASDILETRIGLSLQPRAIADTSNYQQVVRMSAHTDATTDIIKWWNGYRLRDIA